MFSARLTPKPLFAALVIASLGLAGCSLLEEEASPWLPCPEIYRIGGASELTRFAGAGREVRDIDFEVRVDRPQSQCHYVSGRIDSDLRIPFLLRRGAADDDRRAPFRFFVAVSDLTDGEDRILNRQEFEVQAIFEGNEPLLVWNEEVESRIFLGEGKNGSHYRIYVGLVLTPEEHRYNLETR